MSGALITVEDLRVRFPGRHRNETVKAVDGVSFSVAAGETFGIIGESGSGKSTLGRAVVCLLKPTEGCILHGATDPNRLSAAALRRARAEYQIIFQDPNAALNPRMTIAASVREPLDIMGEGSKSDRTRRALEMLERVGLSADMGARYPHELSGGQKQRVNIARVLTLRPKVIVCDEVVAALDVSIRAGILNLFVDLQREFGLTYLFITHDLGVVSHISARVAVMYLGRFMELATPEALERRPLHPYTEALMSAEPIPLPSAMRTEKRIVLSGEIPDPSQPPTGCGFRTRCRHATDRCAAEVPAWREVEPNHFAACHYAGSVTGLNMMETTR
jgi:oligopeptide/dipeptide ABC transporter ATP-binding protein